MIATDLERLGRRFYEAFDRNEPDLLDTVLAVDWRARPAVPAVPPGREGQKNTVRYLHQVFADLRYQVEEVIVGTDDRVVCRARLSGRQVGEFLGVGPTNRQIELLTIEIHTVVGGLIAETWHIEDFFGAYQQMTGA